MTLISSVPQFAICKMGIIMSHCKKIALKICEVRCCNRTTLEKAMGFYIQYRIQIYSAVLGKKKKKTLLKVKKKILPQQARAGLLIEIQAQTTFE